MSVKGMPGAIYRWTTLSVNAGLKNSNSGTNYMVPIAPGTYVISITQKPETCVLTSLPLEVNIIVNPRPSLNLGQDTTICMTDGGLNLKAGNYRQIDWSDGSHDNIMFVRNKGQYSVTVTDQNGCEAKDEISIKNFCCKISYPNIINTSSTTGNHYFQITESNCVITSSLAIYDRWGNLVYKSNNGLEPWDGLKEGKPVETGVYAFIFSYSAMDEDDNPMQRKITGDITVIK